MMATRRTEELPGRVALFQGVRMLQGRWALFQGALRPPGPPASGVLEGSPSKGSLPLPASGEGAGGWGPALEALLAAPPSQEAQQRVLLLLREGLEPLLGESGPQFEVEPGWRLRRRFGHCRHFAAGRAARISISCTDDGDPTRW